MKTINTIILTLVWFGIVLALTFAIGWLWDQMETLRDILRALLSFSIALIIVHVTYEDKT